MTPPLWQKTERTKEPLDESERAPCKNTRVDCHALIQGADLPDPGIESLSPASPELAGGFFPTSATWGALYTSTND